jgi:hypothetical protein
MCQSRGDVPVDLWTEMKVSTGQQFQVMPSAGLTAGVGVITRRETIMMRAERPEGSDQPPGMHGAGDDRALGEGMMYDVTAAMELLAAELRDRGLQAEMVASPVGPVRMKVRNPAASVLSETIIGHAGAFWWPWRDQIGPATDVGYAAAVIVRVLAATER